MQALIRDCFAAVSAQKEYIEQNADYTTSHDMLLADDSAYHAEKWRDAIILAASPDCGDLSEDEIDHVIGQIVELPDYYCDIAVHVQGFPHPASDLTVASFAIGEEEIQLGSIASPFKNGIVEYLNANCPNDAFYKIQKFAHYWVIMAYLDYSYSYVGYELKPEAIAECVKDYRADISADSEAE